MSPVYFFDKPTIMYCQRHDTTEFVYNNDTGMQCSMLGCNDSMWVEFTAEPLAFHDAEEAAQANAS